MNDAPTNKELANFLDTLASNALGDDYIDSDDFGWLREAADRLRKP
jgi:hypothetical protein